MTVPPGDIAVLLTRLDAMDRERQQAREQSAKAYDEIMRTLARMEDRLKKLELADAERAGEQRGRSGIGRVSLGIAAIASAVSGALWAIVDHL